jgi:hypothetical protein
VKRSCRRVCVTAQRVNQVLVNLGSAQALGDRIVRYVDDAELLGAVACPSGELVLIDAESLGHWSGSGIPFDLDGQWVDAEILGPDAAAAAQAFHRQSATMLYDIPRHAQDRYAGLFATLAIGLDARLEILDEQVPHRDRVRRAIAFGDPGFTILGVPVITIGGVPADRPLPIYRDRTRLWVEIGSGPATGVRDLGAVGVDSGRLAFADADALPQADVILGVGDRFFPTRLDLDANGAPCAVGLDIKSG